MTRFKPTIIVRRMVVERGELTVYDQPFHVGVNVIRGENSSGKSTVLNFIYYGLGGDLSDWSAVARLCSRVVLEVSINGNMATLSRDISESSSQQPMEIFGGSLESSRAAAKSEWVRYSYRSTTNRESFSQAMFRLMGVPEVSSDLSGNVTMHQILRLLYADQISPIEDIFRFERFDQASLRDTVGRLLCGAYDSALYDNEQKIRELGKSLDAVVAEIRSLFAVLGKIGNPDQGLTLEWIDAQRRTLSEERNALLKSIELAEQRLFVDSSKDALTLSAQETAYNDVQQVQSELLTAQQLRDSLAFSMADSAAFIASLKSKMEALQDSSKVIEHLGEVRFQSCPACYAIVDDDSPAHSCHLCKTPFDSAQTKTRVSALILDTGLQIRQSEELQRRREEQSATVAKRIKDLSEKWKQLADRLSSLQRLPSTEASESLRTLHRRSGYLDRQVEDLDKNARLVEAVRELSGRREELEANISRLKSNNQALRVQQQNRLSIAYTSISSEIKRLLHNDLRRQDIFEDPESVNFTFSENKISVNGESYFSASSRAILKSSFYLGFLSAATKNEFFRHPRFCMIDTLENMGVEPIRSHNFQHQILRVSQDSLVEHQIIFATAMIAPALEEEAYTVGPFSTNVDMTIAIGH
jgi:AAA domain